MLYANAKKTMTRYVRLFLGKKRYTEEKENHFTTVERNLEIAYLSKSCLSFYYLASLTEEKTVSQRRETTSLSFSTSVGFTRTGAFRPRLIEFRAVRDDSVDKP